jgi:hypothetical protein
VVLDRGQSVQAERDYSFGKVTWGLQATPVLGVVAPLLVVVALGRLVRQLLERLSPARNI